MKSSRLLLAVLALAFLFPLTVSTATAGSMRNGAIQRLRLVVESIDATGGTVAFKSQIDQSLHTYKVDGSTHVVIGMTRGTIDQVKAGMRVYNYAGAGGQPPKEGDTLTVLGVNPATPAAK